MPVLIDTGVLLRAFDANDPENNRIIRVLRRLRERGDSIHVTLQNVAEFWNVGTRPTEVNGYGWSLDRVARNLKIIEHFCEPDIESQASYVHWKSLIQTYSVTGISVHDCRLVSVMLAEGIPRILTLNVRDFRRYPEIKAVTPAMLAKEL